MKNNVRNVLKGFVTAVICVMISGMLCPEASFAASEKTLPDPNDYFDGVCVGWTEDMEEISDIDIAYISDTDLQDAVDAYEAVLISDYSFEFEYYDDRGRGTGPVLAYKGNEEDGKITFWYFGYVEDDVTGMGSGYFVVLIYENVSGFSWISGNKSGGVPEADGAILPDVGIFLNCERGEDMAYQTDGHLLSYDFELDNGPAAVEEVVALLQEPQYELTLTDTLEKDYRSSSAMLCDFYAFSYTGTDSDVSSLTYREEITFDVLVQANYYYTGNGRTGMAIYYSNGFTLVEPDTLAVNQPVDYNSSGSSADSGDANTDNGNTGGHWEWQEVKVDCPSCDNGTCSICNGTGTYRLYGEAVDCPRDCTACDGKGYFTQRTYVYVAE